MPKKNSITVEWLGQGMQGFPKHLPLDHPKKKSLLVQKYLAAQIRPEGKSSMICGVGDFVLMTPEYEGSPPYVGRILDLHADDKSRKMASIQWLYRSKDLKKSARPSSVAKDEIFYALRHVDPVEVDTIIDVIRIEFHLLEGTNGPIRKVKSKLYADDPKAPGDTPCAFTCSRLYDLLSKVVPLSVAKLEELEEGVPNPVSRQPASRDTQSAATITPTRPSAASKAAKVEEDAAATASPSPVTKKSTTKSKVDEKLGAETAEKTAKSHIPASARKAASSGSASTRYSAKSAGSATIVSIESAKKGAAAAMATESSPPSAKRTAPPPVVQGSRKILKVDEEEATQDSPSADSTTQSDSAKSKQESASKTQPHAFRKSSDASVAAVASLSKPSSSSSSKAKAKSDGRASETAPEAISSFSAQKGAHYLDEQLWDLVQEARIHIGRLEAMEVLGYLKLESQYYNNPDGHDATEHLSPPPFIRSRMERPSMIPIVVKALEILNHKNRTKRSTALGIQAALRELEKQRPGVVFGMLARSDSESFYHPNWMFPEAVSGPVFGSMLGMDGFRTLKMKYRMQDMYVPIECEGSLEVAAHRGFAKLVTSRFSFALLKIGDCQFEVAAAPSETYAQIFIKHSTGRMLTAPVPVDEGLLGFVKAIVCANEGILPHQQNLRLQNRGERTVHEDDKLTLKACGIEAFSTILVSEDDDSL